MEWREGGREVRREGDGGREGGMEGGGGGGGGGGEGGCFLHGTCMCMQGHGAAASSVYWSHPSLLPNPPSSVLLPPLISPLSLPLSPSILPCLMHRQIINQSEEQAEACSAMSNTCRTTLCTYWSPSGFPLVNSRHSPLAFITR